MYCTWKAKMLHKCATCESKLPKLLVKTIRHNIKDETFPFGLQSWVTVYSKFYFKMVEVHVLHSTCLRCRRLRSLFFGGDAIIRLLYRYTVKIGLAWQGSQPLSWGKSKSEHCMLIPHPTGHPPAFAWYLSWGAGKAVFSSSIV